MEQKYSDPFYEPEPAVGSFGWYMGKPLKCGLIAAGLVIVLMAGSAYYLLNSSNNQTTFGKSSGIESRANHLWIIKTEYKK